MQPAELDQLDNVLEERDLVLVSEPHETDAMRQTPAQLLQLGPGLPPLPQKVNAVGRLSVVQNYTNSCASMCFS